MGFFDVLKKVLSVGASVGAPMVAATGGFVLGGPAVAVAAGTAVGGASYAVANDVGIVRRIRETGLLTMVGLGPKAEEVVGFNEPNPIKVVRA